MSSSPSRSSAAFGALATAAHPSLAEIEAKALAPGEKRRITLAARVKDLACYDAAAGWAVEPIEYHAIVAHHAHDGDALTARFRVVP